MSFDDAVAVLHAWLGRAVTLTILPEGASLRGRLAVLDAAGIDGALFGLADGDGAPSGVALALFRDAFSSARLEHGELEIRQGQMVLLAACDSPA